MSLPRPPDRFVCRECGYDLAGLVGPSLVTCPECGFTGAPRRLEAAGVTLPPWQAAILLGLPWIPALIHPFCGLFTLPPMLSFLLAAAISNNYARTLQRPVGEQMAGIARLWLVVNVVLASLVAIRWIALSH